MTDHLQPHTQVLEALRSFRGVASSQDLQVRLGVSQATASRSLSSLVGAGEVLKVGAGRSQRYLLPRAVKGVDQVVPIMRVDAAGVVTHFGRIIPIFGGRYWLDEVAGPCGAHDGLPWFMSDMRPQGFIGRTFSRAHPELGLVDNPESWTDDDVLKALTVAGEDLPGNLVVGATSFDRYLSLAEKLERVENSAAYPGLAERALQGVSGGSSAGGEQPKFCTIRDDRHVIVKFSQDGSDLVGQRTRDLLVCEHLALLTLSEAGIPAAESEIFVEEGRVFLEVVRFDRTERGRVGMVSLMAYDAEYIGEMKNWATTATKMETRRLLAPRDAGQLQFLEAYGQLIGNTDRHYGNISLLIENDDWVLSPTYDMLPMAYAPVAGALVTTDYRPEACKPTADTLDVWEGARELAGRFWAAAAADERISADFRQIASRHAALDWPQPAAGLDSDQPQFTG